MKTGSFLAKEEPAFAGFGRLLPARSREKAPRVQEPSQPAGNPRVEEVTY